MRRVARAAGGGCEEREGQGEGSLRSLLSVSFSFSSPALLVPSPLPSYSSLPLPSLSLVFLAWRGAPRERRKERKVSRTIGRGQHSAACTKNTSSLGSRQTERKIEREREGDGAGSSVTTGARTPRECAPPRENETRPVRLKLECPLECCWLVCMYRVIQRSREEHVHT